MFLKHSFNPTFLFRTPVKTRGKTKLTLIVPSYWVAWLSITDT